jgi:type I restriction enzyme S subunit
MSKFDTLIEQLCPDGMEFRELGEVVNLIMGTSPSGNTFSSNPENGIEFHQGKTSFGKEIIKNSNIYTASPIKIAEPNSLIMSVRAPVGDTNFTNRRIAIGRGLCSMIGNDDLSTKFLYYFINENIQAFKNKSSGSTFEAINTVDIKKISIPLPPLPIQQEIVNILDKFTQLEAELQAELEARRKQYEYYRNQLFIVNDDGLMINGVKAECKALSEIGEFIRGKRFVKNDITSEGIPCIHYGEMYTHYKIWAIEAKSYLEPALAAKLRVAHTGDVIIVAAGETVEDIGNGVAWLGESDVVIHDACFAFSHNLNPKYVSYYLHTDLFRSQIKRYISSGKISSINAAGLSKALIPIPPLAEQERIVGILDKFESLVNDISEGLPAEIEARHKQYEYYRGKLLNFKNANNG